MFICVCIACIIISFTSFSSASCCCGRLRLHKNVSLRVTKHCFCGFRLRKLISLDTFCDKNPQCHKMRTSAGRALCVVDCPTYYAHKSDLYSHCLFKLLKAVQPFSLQLLEPVSHQADWRSFTHSSSEEDETPPPISRVSSESRRRGGAPVRRNDAKTRGGGYG